MMSAIGIDLGISIIFWFLVGLAAILYLRNRCE